MSHEVYEFLHVVYQAVRLAYQEEEWVKLFGYGLGFVGSIYTVLYAFRTGKRTTLAGYRRGRQALAYMIPPEPPLSDVCLDLCELVTNADSIWDEKEKSLLCGALSCKCDETGYPVQKTISVDGDDPTTYLSGKETLLLQDTIKCKVTWHREQVRDAKIRKIRESCRKSSPEQVNRLMSSLQSLNSCT